MPTTLFACWSARAIRSVSGHTCRVAAASTARRLHRALAQMHGSVRRSHELYECPRRLRLLRDRQQADREIQILLQVARQRSGVFGTGHRDDGVRLLHADLDLALSHEDRNRRSFKVTDLVLDLVEDAEPLQTPLCDQAAPALGI